MRPPFADAVAAPAPSTPSRGTPADPALAAGGAQAVATGLAETGCPALPVPSVGPRAGSARPGRRAGAAWHVEAVEEPAEGLRRMQALRDGAPTVFQSAGWLGDWCDTIGAAAGLRPLWLSASPTAGGPPAVLWPLVLRRAPGGAWREAVAPDDGVTDYNALLLDPALSPDPADARSLVEALCRILARHADVLHVDKLLLPPSPLGPALAHALPHRASRSQGHRFEIAAGWDLWRQSLARQVRREGERHRRVFERWAGARFEAVTDPQRAEALFERLEAMQRRRRAAAADAARACGGDHGEGDGDGSQTAALARRRPAAAAGRYRLDEPSCRAFYRRRLARGLADGSVHLTCLRVGEGEGEPIAALYGLHDGHRFTVVRIAFDGEAYRPCAPGRLLMERTLRHLYDRGCRRFDLGVGDHAHKRLLGCEPLPLHEACRALTPRGIPAALAWRARPALRTLAARWRGPAGTG